MHLPHSLERGAWFHSTHLPIKSEYPGFCIKPLLSHMQRVPLYTAAETPRLSVWNAETRAPVASALVGFTARSVTFSACGAHLAVGGRCGGAVEVRESSLPMP
jgi:hypothetical protein